MLRAPMKYSAEEVYRWQSFKGEHGHLARPYGFCGLRLIRRLKLAWMVFTGRADALVWFEQWDPRF